MEQCQRVRKPKPEKPINENEIRVPAQGLIRNYITYAVSLFQDKQEKEIELLAMGQAISKSVAIAEIIKVYKYRRESLGYIKTYQLAQQL